MNTSEREHLTQLERRVLRHPDLTRDIEIDRAAMRLMAARSDTPQLLLQHALALEAALQRIQQQLHALGTPAPSAAAVPDAQPDAPAAHARQPAAVPTATGFVRDAALVATGVLGGSLLFHGVASAFSDSPADAAEGADLDFGSDLLG